MARKGPVVFVIALFVLISLSCTNPITSYLSTQTAVMETATATMWTPTPTFTPTHTPTDTPTNTPTFTPTPEYLYMDDFEDPDSDWEEWEDEYVLAEYFDGGFRMMNKQPGLFVWSLIPTGDSYGDVRIEVEGTKIDGPEDSQMGIIARYQDNDNYYVFMIADDRRGVIFKYDDGELEILSGDGMERVKEVNSEALNRIAVVCEGKNLELWVNGELALTATDSAFKNGEVGLAVGNFDVGGADYLFDNFVILPL
ncbi:MAG: hypothetical protein JW748_10085 [Anaerolineales bacterium]|nr:hypothetical protein [Anaerolineales bacterium]